MTGLELANKNAAFLRSNGILYLPGGFIPSEVGEVFLKPLVDLIERQLLVSGLVDSLAYERGVGEGRPYIGILVERPVFLYFYNIQFYIYNIKFYL